MACIRLDTDPYKSEKPMINYIAMWYLILEYLYHQDEISRELYEPYV